MSFSEEITRLGENLSLGGAQYKRDELLQGIKNEKIRLGKNPFIVLVNINSFDMDGLTDYVFLIDSFKNEDDAIATAKNLLNSLLEYQLKQDNFGDRWKLDSKNSTPYLSNPKPNNLFETVFSGAFYTVSGEFDRKYVITRVMKTTGGDVVGQPLFDAINSDQELWSYFVRVGESTAENQNRPTPFFND